MHDAISRVRLASILHSALCAPGSPLMLNQHTEAQNPEVACQVTRGPGVLMCPSIVAGIGKTSHYITRRDKEN